MVAKRWQLADRRGLEAGELEAVRGLQRECEATGGLDLKLTLRTTDDGPVPSQFLARVDARLVGYCGVDLGRDAEVCGMVQPAWRRLGIGSALLDRAMAATAALERDSALVICEDADPVAAAWLGRQGAVLDSTELRMVRPLESDLPRAAPGSPRVELRNAGPADGEAVLELLADGFGSVPPGVLDAITAGAGANRDELLLAVDSAGLPVATLRLYHAPGRSMVYGLVVARGVRGRGYGRAVMCAALARVRSGGVSEVSLEVLPDNQPAVSLYRGLGFGVSATYRYLRLQAR